MVNQRVGNHGKGKGNQFSGVVGFELGPSFKVKRE